MTYRVAADAESLAQDIEHVLLAPIAQEIEALKRRAERAHVRLESGGLLNLQTAYDAIGLLLGEIGEVSSDIEFLMDGQVGLGPANACRDALHQIVASFPKPVRTRRQLS